ncbi:MAG TPA: DUF192 domain-containing protein [Myxococcaceae bacterium]|nr:DUF192 domain-containing protein [Myxococcaceae bacterium]
MRTLLAVALLATLPAAAERTVPRPTVVDPTTESYEGPLPDRGALVVRDAFGGAHRLAVEIADNSPLRTRGLMWRTELPEGTGMLFIFPAEVVQSFWMRNTFIPLDLLFIDRRLQVVGVVQWAEPRTLVSQTGGKPSLYVLEVPGGWTSRNGVRTGSTVELEGTLKERPGQP